MSLRSRIALKIREGTRSDGKRLCDTCRNGMVMRGAAESQEVIYCHQVDQSIPLRVVECSRYDNKADVSLGRMSEIAWILLTDKSGQKAGFISPDRWAKERRDEDVLPYDE